MLLELNCLVLGEDSSHIFTVKISDKETVSIFKDRIWKKKWKTFDRVEPDSLVLWKVSILDDDDFQSILDALELTENSEQLLRQSTVKLSNVFQDEPEEEHIHIIVKPPPAGGFITHILYLPS
jgi:Crinkler effector protein N-terminal domain